LTHETFHCRLSQNQALTGHSCDNIDTIHASFSQLKYLRPFWRLQLPPTFMFPTLAYHAYLIHYTPYADRLRVMQRNFDYLQLDYTVISNYDTVHLAPSDYSPDLWTDRINSIKPILLANTIYKQFPSYSDAFRYSKTINDDPQWLLPRSLYPGEVSVLLKHFEALTKIAFGNLEYGLIFEDDILLNDFSKSRFDHDLSTFISLSGSYLDMAGGAGLSSHPFTSSNCIIHITPPRTRTNACYCVSRTLASYFIENYFPLCFPVDWHLQFLLLSSKTIDCYWSEPPALLHGSETGLIKSWRK